MYNTDGFNERTLYIKNENAKREKVTRVDNSIVKMRIEDNRPDVKTVNHDKTSNVEEAKGNQENFVIQNYNISHANQKSMPNPVSDALNRNRFKKF